MFLVEYDTDGNSITKYAACHVSIEQTKPIALQYLPLLHLHEKLNHLKEKVITGLLLIIDNIFMLTSYITLSSVCYCKLILTFPTWPSTREDPSVMLRMPYSHAWDLLKSVLSSETGPFCLSDFVNKYWHLFVGVSTFYTMRWKNVQINFY